MKKFGSIWEEMGYIVGEADQKDRDEKIIHEKDVTIRKKNDAIHDVIQKKNDVIQEKDDVIQEKNQAIQETIQNLLKRNFSIEQIVSITGLPAKEVIEIAKRLPEHL